MPKIYDITIPIHENMPAFPGDEKIFVCKNLMNVENGDPYSIKKLTLLTHTGTHVDVPSHFIPYGKNLDQIDLTNFIGLADVVKIKNDICVDLPEIQSFPFEAGTIVLFKTKNSFHWKENLKFIENFIYLTPDAAEYLVSKCIKAVGIDYLSIDKYNENSQAPTHLILLKNDIPIIEGLDLSEVPQGRYKLTCLPLKLTGVDGSPVRAILEEL